MKNHDTRHAELDPLSDRAFRVGSKDQALCRMLPGASQAAYGIIFRPVTGSTTVHGRNVEEIAHYRTDRCQSSETEPTTGDRVQVSAMKSLILKSCLQGKVVYLQGRGERHSY